VIETSEGIGINAQVVVVSKPLSAERILTGRQHEDENIGGGYALWSHLAPVDNLVVLILAATALIGPAAWSRGARYQICFSARQRGTPYNAQLWVGVNLLKDGLCCGA
jgi:hypothetical protein